MDAHKHHVGGAYIAHGDVGVVLVLLEHHVLRHTQYAWPDTPHVVVVVVSDSFVCAQSMTIIILISEFLSLL